MYSTSATPVYSRGVPTGGQLMVQAGSQEGMPHAYFAHPTVNPPMFPMYGGAPVHLAPQPVPSYAATPYGYNGVWAAAPSPTPQGAYYTTPQGSPAYALHNAATAPPPNMRVTAGNVSYLPIPYTDGSGFHGQQGVVTLCSPMPPSSTMSHPQSQPDSVGRCDQRVLNGHTPASHNAANIISIASNYEVHDAHLKTPIPVSRDVVVPTSGSERLFHPRGKDNDAQRSRTILRVCEPFLEGGCTTGDRCNDIHVYPDHVQSMRQQLSSWLMDREREFTTIRNTTPDKTFRVFVADLKEVVDIPVASLSFTKGLYVDPATRARRTRGVAPQGRGNVATTQVPTGCGLYSTDPTNCKWGRWCNQVHISKVWMNTRKQKFEQWFTKLEDHYVEMPSEHVFVVHDPQSKLNLDIPKYAISDFTRGLFQGSERKAPSVCLLFQRSRCTAAACCNQIHVDNAYIELVRQRTQCIHDSSMGVGQSLPSPALSELDQKLQVLRQSLLVKESEEVRRLTVEAARRKADARTADTSASADTSVNGISGDAAYGAAAHQKNDTTESPPQPGLFEHIAVDDDEEDTTPLDVGHTFARGGCTSRVGAPILRANASYTNNPYSNVTSLADEKSAGSSTLSLGGLVITPGYVSRTTGGSAGGISLTLQQRSGSSVSRTPAASITGMNGIGSDRTALAKGRTTRTHFDPQPHGSSLFFNISNHSWGNPSGGAHAANQSDYFHNGEGYSSGMPQSAEESSLHFSVTQLSGVNGSTVTSQN